MDFLMIKDEDLLRKMWLESEDYSRKKEIRAHMYKLREARLKEFYENMETKGPSITSRHGDAMANHNFETLKSSEIRGSDNPLRDFTFGQVGGETGGWNVISSSETSDDGKARTEKLLATTEGVSAIDGGKKAFLGRNEELRTEKFDGDANNFTYSTGETSNTELSENIVTGDETNKRIESKSSSSSTLKTSFKSSTNSSKINVDDSKTFEDRSSMQLSQEPNTVREAFRLAQQPGKILSRHVEKANATTNMITERKELDDGTIVTTKRYESIGGDNVDIRSKKSETIYQTLRDDEAFKLSQEPGKILSRDVVMKDPTTRLITEKKELSDGTIVTTKRYETVSESKSTKNERTNSKSSSTRDEEAFKLAEKDSKVISREVHMENATTRVITEKKELTDGTIVTTKKYEPVEVPKPAVRESIVTNKRHENVNKLKVNETEREIVEEKITKKIYDTSCHCPETHDKNQKHSSDFLKHEKNEPYDVNSDIITTNDHVMKIDKSVEEMKKLEEVRKVEQKRVEDQMRVRKESVDKKITRNLEQDASHKAFASSLRCVTPPNERVVPAPRRENTRSPSRETVTKIDRRPSTKSGSPEKQVRKKSIETLQKSSSSPQKSTSPSKKVTTKKRDEFETELFSSTIVIDNKEKRQDDMNIVQTIDTKNLSATTSVSDLEFVVPSRREKSLITDLDENLQIKINLNNMRDTDDVEVKTILSEIRRSVSPDKENLVNKREFKRSETFEERVKKLIGVDEDDSMNISTDTPNYAKPTFASYPNGSALRVSEIRERKAKIERESQEIEKIATRRKSQVSESEDVMTTSDSTNNKKSSNKIDEMKTTKMETKTKAPETHVTVAKITISPTKSTMSSSKTTSVTQINRTVKDTPTTRLVSSTDRDSDNETDQELVRIMDKSANKTTSRKKLITNRKDSAPVKSSTTANEKDKVSRSVSEQTFKTDIVVKPTLRVESAATPKKDSKRPTKCVSTKTINLTNINVNTINSNTLDDVVIDVQQAKSSREPSPNKVVPVPVRPDEAINGHDMIYPDKVIEPDEDRNSAKPKVRNIPIFEEDSKQFIGLEITEVETEKSQIIVEENEDECETINSSTLEVADRKRNSIQIEPIEDEGDEHAHLMSVSQKVNKFIETAEMLKKPTTSTQFKNEKVKLRDNSASVNEKISRFSKISDETILNEKKSKRIAEDIMIRSYDESLRNDECLLSVSDKVNKFISSAEKLTSSEPQRSPELVKNAMKSSKSSRLSDSNETFLTKEKLSSSSQITRDDRSDSKSTVKSNSSDITLKSTEAIKRARAVFETNSTAQRDVKRHDDIMSRPSIWDNKRSPSEDKKSVKSPSPSTDGKTSRRGSSESPRTPAYMRDQVSTKKDIFEKKISSSKLDTESLNRKSLSPQTSFDEHRSRDRGHSVNDEKTHTVTRKISADKHYMSHTVASLEHCQTERKDYEMSRTTTSRRGSSTSPVKYQRNVSESTNDSHVVDAPKSPTKFNVETKQIDSQSKSVKSRRTSGVGASESIDFEQIFNLEELEKLLEIVVGYEQRRRIRSQIRVVKKMNEEKLKSNSVHVRKVSSSSQARKISTGGSDTLTQTRQVTKIMTTVEKPQKIVDSKSQSQKTISSSTTRQKQTAVEKPKETVTTTRIINDKSPRGIIETFNSKSKPVESVVKIVKKTSSTSSSQRVNAMRESRIGNEVTDSVTSSYGVGPTDSNGLPLFGLRALKKKDSNSSKTTGSIITEVSYSENGKPAVVERKTTQYSTDANDLKSNKKTLEKKGSKGGIYSVTTVETFKDDDMPTPRVIRRGSVKELKEKFVTKSSSKTSSSSSAKTTKENGRESISVTKTFESSKKSKFYD